MKSQRMIVKNTAGEVIREQTLTGRTAVTIPLDRARVRVGDVTAAAVVLEFPDAASPTSVGVNGDQRVLGFGLVEMTVR